MPEMKGSPTTTVVGVFKVEPQDISMRNAQIIKNKLNSEKMLVDRADIPDLITCLQLAYGLV